MKVCVLQPDYADSNVDYRYHDPPRELTHLLRDASVDHLFLRKVSVYRQLREAKKQSYDIFVNLCEGYLDWDIPSIDVIWALQALNLPYTGPTLRLYDPAKSLMKYVAHTKGVAFPAFVEVSRIEDVAALPPTMALPLFVKPAHSGDSRGIDEHSLCSSVHQVAIKCEELLPEFGTVSIEQYIRGREFTVLVAGGLNGNPAMSLQPIEYLFEPGLEFKTYGLKVTEHHPDRNVSVRDATLAERLRKAACDVFEGFGGEGYARLDFRLDGSNALYFLDINFACSIFYPPGYEGSADYILANDALGPAGFLRHIIAEGQQRFRKRQKPYERRGNAVSGFGIFATRAIAANEVVYPGEEQSHRIVTRKYVNGSWSPEQIDVFRSYAYPLNDEVFVLWNEDPESWAPQNHSCKPNTAFDGLNVIALRNIATGEELTLDYSTFSDEHMAPFDCHCGAEHCRKRIYGRPGSHVTARARQNPWPNE